MRWKEFDNPEEEKGRLEKLLGENSDNAEVYYELGVVYAYLFDFPKSIEYCEKALKIDPKNVLFHAFYSFVSTNNEDHENAIEALITLIELGADKGDYYVNLAQDAQCGMDKEYALLKVADLRNVGKKAIADKLEDWLVKPLF